MGFIYLGERSFDFILVKKVKKVESYFKCEVNGIYMNIYECMYMHVEIGHHLLCISFHFVFFLSRASGWF